MNATTMTAPANSRRAILDNKIAQGQALAAQVIETIHRDMPTDQIARTKALAFHAARGALEVKVGDAYLQPSEYAVGQLAEKARIPTAYLRELVKGDGWQRDLAAHALGEHFHNAAQERVLLRSVRGQLRGVLSDKYRRLDSRPLVDALATEAKAIGAVPADGVVSETRVAIKLLMPEIVEPLPGEFLVYGGEWSNSDYGNGVHSFRAFALRVVCLNGMTRENLLRQVHLGAKLHDEIEFSERTYKLDTAASVSALRDIVRGALGPKGRERMTDAIRTANDKSMTATQVQAAARGFGKEAQKAVVDAFESLDVVNLPPGNTAWRASNAFSWVARATENSEQRLDLERAAGALV